MKHAMIETNGITMHVIEEGEGKPVLFCHGFPDTWHGWRPQMRAVAAAGYRAIAVDMRGYGRSSAPPKADKYTPFHTVGDLIGVLDALDLPTAVIVGHDFGASVAWNAAVMRPDRFSAVFGISVPFRPRGDASFLAQLRAAGKDDFYMFFQMTPQADAAWADAAKTIPGALYWLSGTPAPTERFDVFRPGLRFYQEAPVDVPQWADPDDVAYTVSEFQRTGFHGGLNYYRAVQLGFDLSAPFKGALVRQPSFFVRGQFDALNVLGGGTVEELRQVLPGLRGYLEIEGVGHWPQREAPQAVSDALTGFLKELD